MGSSQTPTQTSKVPDPPYFQGISGAFLYQSRKGLRRSLWNGWNAHGGTGPPERHRRAVRQKGVHPPVRAGDQPRDLRHRQGGHDAQGRRRGGDAHRLRLHAVQRSACSAFVRLHAGESTLWQELEDRCREDGRQEGNPRYALQHLS